LALIVILIPSIVFVPLIYLFRKKESLRIDLQKIHQDWKTNAPRMFIPGFISTLLAFLVLSAIPLFFSVRLGQDIGMIVHVSAVSISNMLAFLPVTIAGFGTRELVFTEIWQLLDYGRESAVTISTAYFISNYLGSMLVGSIAYLVWFRKHFSLKEIKKIRE